MKQIMAQTLMFTGFFKVSSLHNPGNAGYVECDASFLDLVNGFDHIVLRVTNSAAVQTGAVLLRGEARFNPVQKVAAAKTNVAV